MKTSTFEKLKTLGYRGAIDAPSEEVILWLNQQELLRIEPYWHFLGSDGGFSWSKSWDQFSDRIEVKCETWEELLDIALDNSVEQAL